MLGGAGGARVQQVLVGGTFAVQFAFLPCPCLVGSFFLGLFIEIFENIDFFFFFS